MKYKPEMQHNIRDSPIKMIYISLIYIDNILWTEKFWNKCTIDSGDVFVINRVFQMNKDIIKLIAIVK